MARERGFLNIQPKDFPTVSVRLHHVGRGKPHEIEVQPTAENLVEIWVAVCEYRYRNMRLSKSDVLALIGSLLKIDGEGYVIKLPSFVKDFKDKATDRLTLEVLSVAMSNPQYWLSRVDKVWKNNAPPFDESVVVSGGGRRFKEKELGILYTALHCVLDERTNDQFLENEIRNVMSGAFSMNSPAIKILQDRKNSKTIKIETYARRRQHLLLPECIQGFQRCGYMSAQERITSDEPGSSQPMGMISTGSNPTYAQNPSGVPGPEYPVINPQQFVNPQQQLPQTGGSYRQQPIPYEATQLGVQGITTGMRGVALTPTAGYPTQQSPFHAPPPQSRFPPRRSSPFSGNIIYRMGGAACSSNYPHFNPHIHTEGYGLPDRPRTPHAMEQHQAYEEGRPALGFIVKADPPPSSSGKRKAEDDNGKGSGGSHAPKAPKKQGGDSSRGGSHR